MFGDSFGNAKVTKLLVEHPISKEVFSQKEIQLTRKYGHISIRLFGYPFSVTTRQRARIIMQCLNSKIDDNILDIGCRIGYYTFELAKKHGCKAYGIDFDVNDIILANKISNTLNENNVSFTKESGLSLSFKDKTFDKIILSEVIEHIYDEDALMQELWRVLKPNGFLIRSTPYSENSKDFSEQKSKKYANSKKRSMEDTLGRVTILN